MQDSVTFTGSGATNTGLIMSGIELKGLKRLGQVDEIIKQSAGVEKEIQQSVILCPVDKLFAGAHQPRQHFDEEALDELTQSIKSSGIIQPIIAKERDGNRYEIIAGERRWRAALKAGLIHVPVILSQAEDDTILVYSLIENIQRQRLNALEEAEAFSELIKQYELSHQEIAERVGRSRSAITNTLRLLALDEGVKKILNSGKIEMGHARTLLMLEPSLQLKLAEKVVNKKLSVRALEILVKSVLSQGAASREERGGGNIPDQESISEWVSVLHHAFKRKVSIAFGNNGKGKIVITVDSADDIVDFINKVS